MKHSAFWAPITFFFISMSQPSHRIVGPPSLNPLYFLGAPTICIADAIMVPIRLCVYRIKLPASFSSCLRLVVSRHFAEPDEDRDTEADNLRERRYEAFARSLLTGLGSQAPFIALLGINWTLCFKVLGVMFLISLTVVESLVLCARKMALDYAPLLDDADADESNQALQDAEKIAQNVEDVIVMVANVLHDWLMIYVIVDLWPERREKPPRRVDFPLKFMRLMFEIGIRSGTVTIFHVLSHYSLKPPMQICRSIRIVTRIC
jgi:hypothetical protein